MSQTTRRVDELRPHPLQAKYYQPLSHHELQQLADDIELRGLRQPVDILPDGTILSGHQRVAAAKLNELEIIDVIVHADLADDPIEQEKFLLLENHIRRQATPLQRAQHAQRLLELTKENWQSLKYDRRQKLVRDEVGKLLGITGRQVDNLTAVLKAPRAVQLAVESGDLSIKLAARVKSLDKATQTEIATKLEEGGNKNARKIVQQYFPAARRTRDPTVAYCDLINFLNNIPKHIEKREREIWPHVIRNEDVATFRSGREFLKKMERYVEQVSSSRQHEQTGQKR